MSTSSRLLSRALVLGALLAGLVDGAAPYCVPGQACFPTLPVLDAFNLTVGGRLKAPAPYASVCYREEWDEGACQTLFQSELSGSFRVEQPNALMFTNWELNGDVGCPQPYSLPTSPLPGNCTLGSLPAYEVFAMSALDISRSVTFAAKHNLRLRIKNTGHDYLGRSSAPGSFTIWTHQLKNTSYVPHFVPDGCQRTATPANALIAGAGIEVLDLWRAADQHNVTTIGGFIPTVGAAGGYMLGGGLGPLSRLYGMGVDNVLQYKVVTADGTIKIANECTNTDLFWALRGGGGTFGITTEVTVKAHPPLLGVNGVNATFLANSTQAFAQAISVLLGMQATLGDAGLSGVSELLYPGGAIIYAKPLVNKPETPEETLALFGSMRNIPGVQIAFSTSSFSTWLNAYNGFIEPAMAGRDAVGVNILLGDRVLMKDTMTNEQTVDVLGAFIANMSTPIILQAVAGGAVSSFDPTSTYTSVHPGWRTALLHANFPVFDLTQPALTAQQNETLRRTLDGIDRIIYPEGNPVAYYNEDWPGEPNWQARWFGGNYERLLKIKKTVDPSGVFTCNNCVGSEVFGV